MNQATCKPVQARYVYLSRQQLLGEGNSICQFVSGGRSASAAMPMVSKDLAVAVPTTADVVAVAIAELAIRLIFG